MQVHDSTNPVHQRERRLDRARESLESVQTATRPTRGPGRAGQQERGQLQRTELMCLPRNTQPTGTAQKLARS